jgi:hypothetical protein
MLDVHPPHQAAHSWKDFFIHIATIVVGLIIAVGLEQAVESIHHHYEINETREALKLEREENRKRFVRYCANYRWETAALNNNMLVLTYLEQHPGTPQEKLPGVVYWGMGRSLFAHTAWDSAGQRGVLPLMPQDEVLADQRFYRALEDISNANDEEWLALSAASGFTFKDPDPSHLSAARLAEIIELTQNVMTKHFVQGNYMGDPHALDASFAPGPSEEELNQFHRRVTPAQPASGGVAAAHALTMERLYAAGYPRTH